MSAAPGGSIPHNPTPLLLAIQEGDIDKVKVLIEQGAPLDEHAYISGEDTFPLKEALLSCRTDIFYLLVQKGADQEMLFLTPMIKAMVSKNDKEFDRILEKSDLASLSREGAALNATPLSWAIYLNEESKLQKLLGKGADPFGKPVSSSWGRERSPFEVSLICPSNQLVKLIYNKIKSERKLGLITEQHLVMSALRKSPLVFRYLYESLKKDLEVPLTPAGWQSLLEKLVVTDYDETLKVVTEYISIEKQPIDGALRTSLELKKYNRVEMFAPHASPDAKNNSLEKCVMPHGSQQPLGALEVLLKLGAQSMDALKTACIVGSLDAVRLFIKYKHPVNVENLHSSPLKSALSGKENPQALEIIKVLLKAGSHATPEMLEDLFRLAISQNDKKFAQEIISKPNMDISKVLSRLVQGERVEELKTILDFKLSEHVLTSLQDVLWIPFEWKGRVHSQEIAELFLKAGVRLTGKKLEEAKIVAKEKGWIELLKRLQEI